MEGLLESSSLHLFRFARHECPVDRHRCLGDGALTLRNCFSARPDWTPTQFHTGLLLSSGSAGAKNAAEKLVKDFHDFAELRFVREKADVFSLHRDFARMPATAFLWRILFSLQKTARLKHEWTRINRRVARISARSRRGEGNVGFTCVRVHPWLKTFA